MITEEIRKYILEGKWESEYPRAIEHLLIEILRMKAVFHKHGECHLCGVHLQEHDEGECPE